MVASTKDKQNKISAYLLRASVIEPQAVLRGPERLESIPFSIGDIPGIFYWTKPRNRTPPWVPFLEGLPDQVEAQLRTRAVSAVLFLPIAGRWFAVCFGFGHTLVDSAAVEPEFGLRAGLTAIDPDKIRSLEASSLDRSGSSRRVQALAPSNLADLGLDSERNLITAVMGAPSAPEDGRQIHGRDAVQWSSKTRLADLPPMLQKWLERYTTANLDETYPGWRKMRPVGDPLVIQKLDSEVVSRLKSSPHDRIWIAIPEIVDWEIVEGFVYGRSRKQTVLPDIDADSFCAWFGDMERLTLDSLKAEDVFQVVGGGRAKHWKVYKCIYAEIEESDTTFILVNGLWFRADNDFVEATNRELAGRWTTLGSLPALKEREKDYNRRVAGESDGRIIVVDCKCVMHGGGRSRLEVCDLLDGTGRGQLIHVKCYGNSGVLSYLFDQGIVSARCLTEGAEFRTKVTGLLPESHRRVIAEMPDRKPDIVYAIATKKGTLDEKALPFFSRVILASYIRELEARGFKVILAIIRDVRDRATQARKQHRSKSKVAAVEGITDLSTA